ncbi:glycosyltransferase family 4 protein [Fulvivirga sedimenti]|uniref:Glycosyltransferase family 4 protein n=1 Tax=Fulvivirga sedimenti TaxID=2879465 RepID=A0A9X1KVV2_9BACT|nr:glycosyltransferase family 4 protein [Fulvivirga sedimenti]MCA6075228.1 glycosyltransferase family 4 protein [Fulvivirga sedimenti]MCA6076405.1 glycosyltransferase family 4 protein [Fulvivirga sedimenti]MCA6077533.1 glycosyltransferase family 4 protein [Fulvivirga sedimenti]
MKTVLIITYYWPPSGGSGVQRWMKFANYLEDEGWHPVILTPENPQFVVKDDSLEQEVNENIEVLRIPIWEPYQLFEKAGGNPNVSQGNTSGSVSSIAKFIRGNFFLPDPRVFWRKPAVRFLKDYLKSRRVDFIVTTGPPHSIHLIGLSLKGKFNIPWLADFRDPWSDWDMLDEFHTSALARSYHRKMERKVAGKADILLTVSPSWAETLHKRYDRQVEVITNGFDTADFSNVTDTGPDNFSLAHFGLINQFRHAPAFWEALEQLQLLNPEIHDLLKIDLYGVMDPEIHTFIESWDKSGEQVTIHGSISHKEVIESYRKCTVVLMFMNKSSNAKGHIPGKLFEYLSAGKPILAIGDPEGDAATIIRDTGAGVVLRWDDTEGICGILNEWYLEYKKTGSLPGPDRNVINRYSRKELTTRLASLMNKHAG